MQTKLSWKVATTAPVLIALAIAAVGCATTEMTSTWTDPTARGASMARIAVIALSKDPGLRRMAEDTAASQMRGAQAVPSYEVVKAKLLAQGFQGVLVMRMAGVTEQVTAVGGPYGTFDGYYDWAGSAVYAPGYLETDTIVHVVSNLYSLDQNKLVWSGVSQTFDPASAKSFMTDVSKAVAKSLEKDRLIL
jgi:hypothetical protein